MDRSRLDRIRMHLLGFRRRPVWLRAVRVYQPSAKRGVRSMRTACQPTRFALRAQGLRG